MPWNAGAEGGVQTAGQLRPPCKTLKARGNGEAGAIRTGNVTQGSPDGRTCGASTAADVPLWGLEARAFLLLLRQKES